MDVGIQLPEVERVVRWSEVRAMARAAEERGFASVWLGDHHLYRGDRAECGPWEAWTQLAALAAVTERMRLGPLVAATAFHRPGFLARMAASVDEISGGRFVFGIGAGWNEPELRAFGLPFDHLGSRFAESFEIVRRLLAGEHVTFAGRYHAVDDAVILPPLARRVPLMIGSNGERVLIVALPHVDAWNAWYSSFGNTPEGFAAENAKIDALCRRVGREPGAVRRTACVLVRADGPSERPHECAPIALGDLRTRLAELEHAGVDEAILVVDPIDERSIRAIADRIR